MSTKAWRDLSDEEPVPFEPGPFDDLWPLLPVALQQRVARGEITLEEVMERMTSTNNAELCPACAARPVTTIAGTCSVCARRRLRDVQRDLEAEVLAVREHDTAKQQLHRARELVGDALPDALRARQRRRCDSCGSSFTSRTDETLCASCRDEDRHPRHSDR